MASKRVKDLAVKVGEYTKDGETKGRYENIGSMMKTDDGNFFLFIKKTFNPAGVWTEEGRESIIVGVFDLKDQAPAPQQQASRPAPAQQPRQQSAPQTTGDFSDDDIPF